MERVKCKCFESLPSSSSSLLSLAERVSRSSAWQGQELAAAGGQSSPRRGGGAHCGGNRARRSRTAAAVERQSSPRPSPELAMAGTSPQELAATWSRSSPRWRQSSPVLAWRQWWGRAPELAASAAELSGPPRHATAAATFHCEPIQRCGGLGIPLYDRILAQRRCRRRPWFAQCSAWR